MRLGPRAVVALLALAVLSPSAAWAAPDPPDLSGTWAELRVMTEVQPVPLVGDVTIVGRYLALHRIDTTGSTVRTKGRMCGIQFDASHRRVRPSVAPSFLDALGTLQGEANLRYNRKGKRWEMAIKKRADVLGAKLKKPAREALPTDAKDPRVNDPDGDGRPGVTVSVSGLANGRMYLVRRVTTALRGIVRSQDAVDGILTWSREQSVVGASTFILRNPPVGKPHPDKSRHTFRMRRVAPETTCATLLAQASALFPSMKAATKQ